MASFLFTLTLFTKFWFKTPNWKLLPVALFLFVWSRSSHRFHITHDITVARYRFTFMLLNSLSARYAGALFTHFTGGRAIGRGTINHKTNSSFDTTVTIKTVWMRLSGGNTSHRRPPGGPPGPPTSRSRCSPAASSCWCSCTQSKLSKTSWRLLLLLLMLWLLEKHWSHFFTEQVEYECLRFSTHRHVEYWITALHIRELQKIFWYLNNIDQHVFLEHEVTCFTAAQTQF